MLAQFRQLLTINLSTKNVLYLPEIYIVININALSILPHKTVDGTKLISNLFHYLIEI